jgi:hypothetical protein
MTRRCAIFAVLSLAGCGDRIDAGAAEDLVKDLAERSVRSEVASVACPRAERKQGVVLSCRVRFVEGGEHPMRLVIVNERGGFHPSWERPVVSRRAIAGEASATLATEVDCGSGVEAAPVELRCALAGGEALVIDVDASGAWRSR